MSTNNKRVWGIVLFVLTLILACNFPSQVFQQRTATSTAIPTLAITVTQVVPNQVTQAPPVISTQPSPVTSTLEPTLNPTPTIVHLIQPSNPPGAQTWASDLSSRDLAGERRAVGDNFSKNLFERPFTSQMMDYQPYLDLTRVELSYIDPWYYVTIILVGEPPAGSQASYAIEIDLDRDGRGDWYISTETPPSSDWTTVGVRAWRDPNKDVGGANPILADAPVAGLDGYEELVFNQGQGSDPDAAWARRDPSSRNQIQIAFKLNLIGSASGFLFGGWSDEGVRKPGWLDYNDHFTIAEAGSPVSNSNDYPLKALASVDNTCRWAFGFNPTKELPGLCPLQPTPTPTTPPKQCQPPPTGCPVFGAVKLVWNTKTCKCELP